MSLTANTLGWLNVALAGGLYLSFISESRQLALFLYIVLLIGLLTQATGNVAQSFYLSPPGPQGYQLADGRTQKTCYL